ncbi:MULTISPECIES: hypothetical protein [unclassified Microcoleus]|uniref:hypothetical protein n=1 Tax=unclassified Microcoleus TaxID=2642155 RepID=UPI002FCFAF82
MPNSSINVLSLELVTEIVRSLTSIFTYPILSPLGVDESLFAVSTGEGARICDRTHKKK